MKLIVCTKCNYTFSLKIETLTCLCGESGGHYLDDGLHAEVWGPCIPLGFANWSFVNALRLQPEYSPGLDFVAFVIEKNCPTVKVLEAPTPKVKVA